MAGKMWTVRELAKKYNYSERQIRRMLQQGKITGKKPAGKLLISDEEVQRFFGWKRPAKLPAFSELVDLLRRWREQAQFWSLDEFLRAYAAGGLQEVLVRHMSDGECVANIYDTAKQHHIQPFPSPVRLSLKVEQEGLFHRLRQCLPDDPMWEAQDCWGTAYGEYFEAFASWYDEVRYDFELYLALALKEEIRERGRQVASGVNLLEQLKKEDVNWDIFLRLASLVVSCDLLAMGIQDLPTNQFWFFQIDRLKMLRGEVVSQIAMLPTALGMAQGDIGAAARLLWEHEPKVQEETRNLLQTLHGLQASQDNIITKLMALESRLYDVAESLLP